MVVDHTTTSPDDTAARAARMEKQGVAFLHAPVFMGPPNALAGTGVMLASGDRARFDALAPHLERMTGKLVYLGEDPSRAAAVKLLGNHFLVLMTTGLIDTLMLAKGLGVPREEVSNLFSFFNPGPMIPARLGRIMEGDFAHPSWNLAMARKDVRLMLEGAERGGVTLSALPAIARNMDQWLAEGHGDEDWTVTASPALD